MKNGTPKNFREGKQSTTPLSLQQKLHPQRFTAMSGRFAACVGCIVGARYTSPEIAELCITSDNFVLARTDGDCGFNEFIGTEREFFDNWRRLLDSAGLNSDQRSQASLLYSTAFATPHGRRSQVLKRDSRDMRRFPRWADEVFR